MKYENQPTADEETKPDDQNQKRLDDQKLNDQQVSEQDNDIDTIDITALEQVKLSVDEQKMFDDLDKDLGFQVAIEELLVRLDGMDTPEIQSRILLLLYQFCDKRADDHRALRSLIQKKQKEVDANIKILSVFIMQTRAQIINQLGVDGNNIIDGSIEKGISTDKNKYQYLNKQSRQGLRNIIKRFAVYELYKFINPRKIAGETRKQNFIHNMLVGGLRRASRYTGGGKYEIKNYDPNFIKNLQRQHEKLVSSNFGSNNKGLSM